MDKFGYDNKEDTVIWMTEQEFQEAFTSVTVCQVREDDETLRLKGEFVKGNSGRALDKGVRSRYQYEIQLDSTQNVSALVH